jgi:hypothetical protein
VHRRRLLCAESIAQCITDRALGVGSHAHSNLAGQRRRRRRRGAPFPRPCPPADSCITIAHVPARIPSVAAAARGGRCVASSAAARPRLLGMSLGAAAIDVYTINKDVCP